MDRRAGRRRQAVGDLRAVEIGRHAGAYAPAFALAPARVFYAHRDYVHEAALIVLADSILQEHRGCPMLIDMADGLCKTYFGAETLNRPTQTAFAEIGQPYRYLDERTTRT